MNKISYKYNNFVIFLIDQDSAACTAFGVGLKGLSIDSIDAMYSLGCRTWREKHVQCGRDLERVKILSDKFPQITHSEFLVVTGSYVCLEGQKMFYMTNMTHFCTFFILIYILYII